MKEIIAIRSFDLLNEEGKTLSTFEIKVFKPIEISGDWRCTYSINDIEKSIIGIDSFQALHLCLGVIKNELQGISERNNVRFLEQENLFL